MKKPVVKSRVHAAADKAWAPSMATVKLNCYGAIQN